MIIYLSGPMTGIPNNNFPAFNSAAKHLRAQGHTVINPAEITLPEPEKPINEWAAFVRADIKQMMDADTIALLPGWDKSAGAGIEITIAAALEMDIVDAETLEPIALDVKLSINNKDNIPNELH